jgi:hypothetical protein
MPSRSSAFIGGKFLFTQGPTDETVHKRIRAEIFDLCEHFPVPAEAPEV